MHHAVSRFISNRSFWRSWLRGSFCLLLLPIAAPAMAETPRLTAATPQPDARLDAEPIAACQRSQPRFLVMAGGGDPSYNEIALEKNVLYFQRTLQALSQPDAASIYFANGNDGQATVRYLDPQGVERFKPPEIPELLGAATLSNFWGWLRQAMQTEADRPVFFYFTGHGYHNRSNEDNNAMILWNEDLLSVQQFAAMLDEMPATTPFVTMMSQCYSGAFANFIYEGGDPSRPVALQTRCGFFATVKSRPSVGCTPEVNEADYRDYSSSFFAGLSGRSRTGETVASADYDRNNRVSYAEAHAFAKIDGETTDLPISTLENWLQNQATAAAEESILTQPIASLVRSANPAQTQVIQAILNRLRFDANRSFYENLNEATIASDAVPEIEEAYMIRLGMELVNVGVEDAVRSSANSEKIATLDRLMNCENGSW